MIKYTRKQQKELEKNPYTYKVTENRLFFTKEFKKVFWIKYNAGMSPRAILKELGYDLMSENENGLIMLTADDGSEEAFFVLEKADIAGVSYLLVTDSVEDEEAEAMILREETEDELVTYQVVDDEKELKIISKYLEELLDDVELRLE